MWREWSFSQYTFSTSQWPLSLCQSLVCLEIVQKKQKQIKPNLASDKLPGFKYVLLKLIY